MRTTALWMLILTSPALLADPGAKPPVDFKRDIEPVLKARCVECHAGSKQKGGYRLDNRAGATDFGDTGKKGIVPGKSAESLVMARVRGTEGKRMPPKGDPLTPAQIDAMARWIDAGAPFADDSVARVSSDHWAFRKPMRPEVPATNNPWSRSPIDAFILSRLAKAGLKPNPEADRATLLRRLSLDITGLPPTPEEMDQFMADSKPGALDRQVDRLLASPRYGERMARQWLDLARYADSKGYGSDPLRPYIWRYRDWVIDAYNRNLPYDQFSIEQLAGDLLPNATDETRLATAFHRNTMTNTEGGTDDEEFRVAAIKDRVDTTAQVWMALTLGCAKCHTHKFDPITQKEYYQVFAIFNQTADNDHPEDLPRLPTPTAEQAARKAGIAKKMADLRGRIDAPAPLQGPDYEIWRKAIAASGNAFKPLVPKAVTGSQAATYTVGADGLVRLTSPVPAATVTTVDLGNDLDGVTAIRLEIPKDGASAGGNVVIDNLRLEKSKPGAAAVTARFLRLDLPGAGKMIHIAEAQVFQGNENIARKGKASQSTTAFGGDAAKGIDGNTDGHFVSGSVTHTAESDSPWWEVDLGKASAVDRVVIFTRVDGGLYTRMDGMVASLLDDKRQPIWKQVLTKAPAVSVALPVAGDLAVALGEPSATHEQPGFPARAALGTSGAKVGWGLGGGTGTDQALVIPLVKALSNEQYRLVVSQNYGTKHVMGRFRIGVTRQVPPPPAASAGLVAALAKETRSWTVAERDMVQQAWNRVTPARAELNAQMARLDTELKAVDKEIVSTPVMQELPADRKRVTNILVKGNFLTKGDPVNAGVPSAFHALPKGSVDRLAFSQWIVSPENPLTARVAVNRLWAQIFGRGLVETEEDFGIMGSKPTNPELLDWLATEYVRMGWDTKALMRMIVLSAVYRQDARVEDDHQRIDPRNELLAHFPRQRLEAEMVRDQALAVSGLLSGKMGGPSVYPPQPAGLWQAAFNGERTYPTSMGEDRYRRGIYSFWRRTVPPPGMQAFDAPSRESCTVRRIGSNTPLQAFVTLNDPVYVEAAQALARRMAREGGTTWEGRIERGWKLCLGRAPSTIERDYLLRLMDAEKTVFQANAADAAKLAGAGELPSGTTKAEIAAATVVANVLLNLDAFLTRN